MYKVNHPCLIPKQNVLETGPKLLCLNRPAMFRQYYLHNLHKTDLTFFSG